MKILQILTELEPGGAERVALNIACEASAQGHLSYLAVLKNAPKNKTLENAFLTLGITPFYLNMQKKSSFVSAVFQLRALIKKLKPDVVHAHLMHPNLISRFANLFLNVRLVNTIHIAERRPGKGFYFLADGLTIGLCDVCTAVSDAAARYHEKMARLDKNSIRTIYNGVDPVLPLSPDECRQLRIRWNLDSCSRIIGAVGRLDPQKGFDLLIRSLRTLSKHIPAGEKWGVVIIGEGAQRSDLETLARTSIPANILFRMPGFSANAAREISAFDTFVMPSRYEGYGLVFAEAMTLGVPCVVSNADSLPELAAGYPSAQVVDFSDCKAVAEAISRSVLSPRCSPHIILTRALMFEKYLEIYSS